MSDLPTTIGRYHIVKRLGRGGMGVVYLARDPLIGRDVAIKVLRTLDEADLRARFAREIQIAGALAHPNIVRIYDAGEFDEQPFVAMEYVSGPTLDHYIKSGTPVSLDRKLELLADLADGLAHAHARKVVHRDIKPSNLIIDDHDRLKILDFGIARFAAAGNVSLVAVGTPSYMAPEQIRGEVLDTRCDIFAVGVVAYELFSYRKPFVGESHQVVQRRILSDAPAPLEAHDPRLPRAVTDLVLVALQKRPEDRFQSAQALGEAIRSARASLSPEESTVVTAFVDPPPPAADSSARPSTSPSAAPSISPSPRPAGKRSQRVAEVRQRLLETAKDAARRAMSEGRIDAALQAAEQALAVDDTDAEAAELLEQARQSLDHSEAERLVAQARAQMAAGALVSARQTLEGARALWPDSTEIEELDRRIARQIREREEQVQRARACTAAVARARLALDAGDLKRAQVAIAEALERDPANPEALEVKDLVQARGDEAEARARWEAQAEAACRMAEEEFTAGAQLDAIQRLEGFSPPHPRVTGLLAELRIRRRALLDEQRRATANAKRQRQIDQAAGAARAALEARDVVAAMAALNGLDAEARAADPVRQLIAEAESILAADERDRAERRAAGLAAAAAALTNGDTRGARTVLDDLVAAGLGGVEVDQALAAVAEAEEEWERRRQRAADLKAGLERVRAAVSSRDLAGANEALRRLASEGFTPDELAPATAAIEACKEELASDRAREQARAQTVTVVERALAARNLAAARQGLEQLRDLGGPTETLAKLESECEVLEAAIQAEQGREQRRRDGRAAVEAAIARRDEAGARSELDDLKRDGLVDADFQDVVRRLERLARELAHERDLAARRETARRVVAEALDARDVAAVRAGLARLRALGADDVLVRGLEERVDELKAELDAEAEALRWRTEQLAVVERALDQRRADEASSALKALRERGARGPDIDACAARAATLHREIAEAREREARLEATLADVTAAVEHEDLSAAQRLLAALEGEGASGPKLDAARARVAEAAAAIEQRKRREAELRRGLDEVERALASEQPEVARRALATLRKAGFAAAVLAGADQRLGALDEALQQAREQAARAKEQERERERVAAELAARQAREAEATRLREAERLQREKAERERAAAELATRQAREAETARLREAERLQREKAERERAASELAARQAREAEAARRREAERLRDETRQREEDEREAQRRRDEALHEKQARTAATALEATEALELSSTLVVGKPPSDDATAAALSDPPRIPQPPPMAVAPRRWTPAALGGLLAILLVVIAAGWGLVQWAGSPAVAPEGDSSTATAPDDAGPSAAGTGTSPGSGDTAAAARETAVNETLAAARNDAESGRLDAGIERLRQFAPADPRVDDLRASLEALRTENRAIADEQAFVSRLDDALRSRDLTMASSVAAEALTRFPKAPAVVDGVRRLARAAQQETSEARAAALPRRGTPVYNDAARIESRANQLMASAPLEAFRQYRQATDSFVRAVVQAVPSDVVVDNRPRPEPPPPITEQQVPPPPGPGPIPTPPPQKKDSDPGPAKPPAPVEPQPGPTPRPEVVGNRPTAEVARGEILQLVRAFEAAYSAMDEGRLRELQPSFTGIPGRALLKSVRLTITDVQIRLADDLISGTVTGTSNYQYDWRRAGFPAASPAPLSWTVVRTEGGWRVR